MAGRQVPALRARTVVLAGLAASAQRTMRAAEVVTTPARQQRRARQRVAAVQAAPLRRAQLASTLRLLPLQPTAGRAARQAAALRGQPRLRLVHPVELAALAALSTHAMVPAASEQQDAW